MVTNDEAAFRILEISAILFPLLFIVVQLYGRHVISAQDSPIGRLGNFVQYIVYASLILLMAVAGAATELVSSGYSLRLKISILGLYIAFLFLGFTAALMGMNISTYFEGESEQVDLTTSLENIRIEAEVEHEPED